MVLRLLWPPESGRVAVLPAVRRAAAGAAGPAPMTWDVAVELVQLAVLAVLVVVVGRWARAIRDLAHLVRILAELSALQATGALPPGPVMPAHVSRVLAELTIRPERRSRPRPPATGNGHEPAPDRAR